MKKTIPFIALVVIVLVFFWKVAVRGLVPVPGDFTVGIYYPWLDYKWGYSAGVPVKNLATNDVASYTYPIQSFNTSVLKKGLIPLWNPKILAGTPLFANFQAAVLSPTNFVYFLFDQLTAWSFQIILQHVLAAVFTYLLLRHWKVSKIGSVLGGIVFAFSGFNLIWSQWNGHTLTSAFIPLLILCEDLFLEKHELQFGVGVSIILFLQIMSGYPQTVIYTLLAMALLWGVKIIKSERKIILSLQLFLFIILGLGLSSFLLLPGAEIMSLSQRVVEKTTFDWAFLPWVKIITFISSDFFGNPATQNYWSNWDFFSNEGFVGVVAFSLALLFFFANKNVSANGQKIFLALLTVVSLILSFPTPLAVYLWKSNIFGLNAMAAHRALVLFNLGISLAAGFGYDFLQLKLKTRHKLLVLLVPLLLLVGFGIYALEIHQTIGLRNLVLPSGVFVATACVVLFKPNFRLLLIPLGLVELFYFGWKYTPFSPRNIVFPQTPVLSFLEKQNEPFRVSGGSVVPVNMLVAYGLETLDGYDAVYPLRMSQFISALNSGTTYSTPMTRYAVVNNNTSRLMDLANAKFYLALRKDGRIEGNYDSKRFKIIFADQSVVVLENLNALPRAFMVYDWEIVSDDKQILSKLLDPTYPLNKKIILEENVVPVISVGQSQNKVVYLNYDSQESEIGVETTKSGFLFVSDSFYPGWRAYLDGQEAKIYRADYIFRAIEVPAGKHIVKFIYHPDSFYRGLKLSSFSALVIAGTIGYTLLKRKTDAKD